MDKIKKMKFAILGCGNRGQVYADYALQCPDEAEVVAVIDPNPVHLKETGDRHNVPAERRFENIHDFLAAKIECDSVVNATMDQQHYETSLLLIEAGYNQLLEKPICPKESELLDLEKKAKEKGVSVLICHVLRYAPFYKKIKEILNQGTIGRILTLEQNEHVKIGHFIDSFVRGKWNDERRCGSGLLLAKCCHDTDLMCWINNESAPVSVSSFGQRAWFTKENAPKDSTEYCYNCPHTDTCLYSAQKIQLDVDEFPFQTWEGMGKPVEDVTYEEKVEYLKTNEYGKCAYKFDVDLVDRQVVSVSFANGSTATLTLVGGAVRADRYIHIVGDKGEIEGHMIDEKFILRTFDRDKFDFVEEIITVSDDIVVSDKYGGHGGGDFALMNDYVRFLQGADTSISITRLDDSLNGHKVVYAAEKSRRNGTIEKIK